MLYQFKAKKNCMLFKGAKFIKNWKYNWYSGEENEIILKRINDNKGIILLSHFEVSRFYNAIHCVPSNRLRDERSIQPCQLLACPPLIKNEKSLSGIK